MYPLANKNRETINIPIRGFSKDVDIHDFKPIVNHPHMSRLRYISQLGGAALVWPAANHNRLVHSIGTSEETRLRLRQWPDTFPDEIVRLIRCYGLVHDIGHFPFSHPTETVVGYSHDRHGVDLLEDMRPELRACGVEFDELIKLCSGKDPLSEIVANHPFGTDKIDYTVRDALLTALTPPNVAYFDKRISWMFDRLVIDSDQATIMRALEFRKFYVLAYGECYLHPLSSIIQRLIEKLWECELEAGRKIKDILKATDGDAIYWFSNSQSDECCALANHFLNRRFAHPVIVFRLPGCSRDEQADPRIVKLYEVSKQCFTTWNKVFNTPQKLSELEREFEKKLVLDRQSIMIVPQFNIWRFDEKPIWTYFDGCLHSVDELYPTEAMNPTMLAQHYTAWRVCVFNDVQAPIVYKNAELFKERLLDFCK